MEISQNFDPIFQFENVLAKKVENCGKKYLKVHFFNYYVLNKDLTWDSGLYGIDGA